MPSLEPGAGSSIYELAFKPALDADVRVGLGVEAQMCRHFFVEVAERIGDGDLFRSTDAVWVGAMLVRSIIVSFIGCTRLGA